MKRLLRRFIPIKRFKSATNRKRNIPLDVGDITPYIYLNRMIGIKRIDKALKKIK